MLARLRRILHRSEVYWQIREGIDEGLVSACHRLPRQRAILKTPPVRTTNRDETEVRLLTYRADWLNAIWALKTFYMWSGVDLPLHIHDGGLLPRQAKIIREHFPDCHFHDAKTANQSVEDELRQRGFTNSLVYRRKNKNMWKFFDFYLNNSASRVITLDSDILFFAKPGELLEATGYKTGPNVFNRDFQYSYVLPQEEMNKLAGTYVQPYLNGGMGCVSPSGIDFSFVDYCMGLPEISNRFGVVEQSMQALCAARFGLKLLSQSYVVSLSPGLPIGTVAKHYPSWPRPWLYREGMAHLLKDDRWLQLLAQS